MDTIVTLGDSIAWGQGLLEDEKYSSRVTAYLRGATPRDFEQRIAAHSGAVIGIGNSSAAPLLNSEVPVDGPTILQQVRMFQADKQAADAVVLVLLNGGINDLGVNNLLNPLFDPNEIRRRTAQYCFEDMKTVLRECLQTFANARIVITGYYQLLSEDSDALLLPAVVGAFGLLLSSVPGALFGGVATVITRKIISDNCRLFASTANDSFARAADTINKELAFHSDARAIGVAVPAFGPINAALASESYSWGLRFTGDPTELFVPIDSVINDRVGACHLAFDSGQIPDYARCKIASAGHPNPQGAAIYSAAIRGVLNQWLDDGWLGPFDRLEWMALLL